MPQKRIFIYFFLSFFANSKKHACEISFFQYNKKRFGYKIHINERNDEIDYEIEHMLNNAKEYSIEDSEYEAYSPKAYKYAMDMTVKECNQAVEGMYHNLNTLQ